MKTIPLTNGQYATVDDADYQSLSACGWHSRWNESTSSWYAVRSADISEGVGTVQMSRQILGLTPGDPRQADHRNHDTLDNRRENLRVATRSENCRNRMRRVDNRSGFKGVSWNRERGQWRAQIWTGSTNKLLGTFADPVSAAKAYDEAACERHGEFALLNFPLSQTAAQEAA